MVLAGQHPGGRSVGCGTTPESGEELWIFIWKARMSYTQLLLFLTGQLQNSAPGFG